MARKRKQKYTGVGSRTTPRIICEIATQFARTKKEILRSGAAKRMDESFEDGATNTEIYLPWKGFMKHRTGIYEYTEEQIQFAEYLVWKVYPVLVQDKTHLELFRRNVFQCIGLSTCVEDADPSKFLLCWTPDGCVDMASYKWGETGGTGVAIMVAREFDIPVFNMRRKEHMKMVLAHLDDHGLRTVNAYKKQLMDMGLYR
jgi:hypothetical protein